MIGPFLRREGDAAPLAVEADRPALGLIETASIARGFVVADAMLKRAPVELVLQRTVSPGKHLTLVAGGVADVGEAMAAGLEAAAEALVDRLELAQVADELLRALCGAPGPKPDGALGIFETHSVAATLLGADAACKGAEVRIAALRLADGLGGKAYVVLAGEQGDVEAGLDAAERVIVAGQLRARELIARPHDDLLAQLA